MKVNCKSSQHKQLCGTFSLRDLVKSQVTSEATGTGTATGHWHSLNPSYNTRESKRWAVRAADAAARRPLGASALALMMGLRTRLMGEIVGNVTVILSPPVNLFVRLDWKGQWRNWFT